VFKTNKLFSSLTVALGLVSISTSVSADPWASSPGTKARAMGSAFVAIANDPSAAWHNPAGLFQMKGINVSLEHSEAPFFDTDESKTINFNGMEDPKTGEVRNFLAPSWGSMTADNDSYFVSLNGGDGETSGWSIYYYQPYFITSPAITNINEYSEVVGKVEEEVSILGFGYAGDVFVNNDRKWFSSLHYGLTLELIETEIGESEFDFYGSNGKERIYLESIDVESAFSGSLGILSTIYNGDKKENLSPTIKFGGVYRFGTAGIDTEKETYNDRQNEEVVLETQDFFNSKPSSWDMGLSADMKLGSSINYGLFSLELATQIGETEFDSVLTNMAYEKVAHGAALRWSPIDSFVNQVEFRMGVYTQESNSHLNSVIKHNNALEKADYKLNGNGEDFYSRGLIYPDVEGATWGIQLAFSGGLILEFAQEERELNNSFTCFTEIGGNQCIKGQEDTNFSETFTSMALRFSW